MVYDEFKDRAGEIVSGTVRRFERSNVIVDLGRFEAVMPQSERVQTEDFAIGDRIRAYVLAVENGRGGPEIILSRSHPNFVRRLFEVEVSEIADRTVEIKGIAREAGFRTKIAVHSADGKVDPVGACVGMKGARVKNIVRELNNEKVDIIKWTSDPKEFAVEALKPARVKSVQADPARKSILVKVDEDQLSQAIGKRGQNARLTSRLVGWEINIEKDESKKEAFEGAVEENVAKLAQQLGVGVEIARALNKGGVTSPEVAAEMSVEEIIQQGGEGGAEITPEQAQAILDAASALQGSEPASNG
jgi:N utilization substance protein A